LDRERIYNTESQAFGDVCILLRVLPSVPDFGGDREGNHYVEKSNYMNDRVLPIAAAVAALQCGRTIRRIAMNA
jgi:hypothetical protein